MGGERFFPDVIVRLGPVEVTATVVYSLIASAIVIALAFARADWPAHEPFELAGRGRIRGRASRRPHARHVRAATRGRIRPLVVTLALFIGTANLLGLVPGMQSPTADFSTTAALAIVVFLAVPFYGIRARGLRGYLRHYLEPIPCLLPLEIITEFSRTLALAVRLFGNIMSEELVIAVLLSHRRAAGAGPDHDARGADQRGTGLYFRRSDGRLPERGRAGSIQS